ncbi:PLP-dependent aminotransferase family protein [Aromatoleum petrolei]|uniref:Aminotransferase class I/II-fold pyridoxal phosphate-dependent enzyme n=1 Tax=Aromatoleum petrolei TaxID=76116 RepID=A0ABX1MS57_9RHOO|nr:PLP-dependent aminotransferase family protein [Aromatoleum petrolei]NMF89491.1 aminotransferase class I/II-fold pyridoxal phosphate-dependent enzyme [Aromatoleum petrolei]QTQ36254.1 Transcriptional regulator, GntR family [Aromatoleum petrolei]
MMEHWREALDAVRGGESKYKILVQAIAADIENGSLAEGTRLPPQREVSQKLGISVQTVTNAYKELEQHGVIRCEVGRGSFVAKRVTEKVASYMLDRAERSLVDFSIARIVYTEEHDAVWRETCAALAAQPDQPWMRACRPIAGFEHHRAAAVEWLAGLGMKSSIETLLITNGASHAQFLALASLVSPGDTVLTDSLTDHGVIGSAQVLGFTLKGLDSDEYGIQPDHFEDMCANERITALVCTPNLNNPTSSLMPDSRRRAIARIAERYGVYVIEDDVFGPLLTQRPAPITSHLPELGFYLTSFTKSLMTGLRTGYLAMPRRLALRVESILRVNSWMATPLLAEVATRWIADGTAEHLVQVQRECLALRHKMVEEHLGEFAISNHPCSLSTWVGIPGHWQLDSLVQQLRHRLVAVTSPDPFLVLGAPRPNAIRLCLGAEGSDVRINGALGTIASVFRQYPQVHDYL